MKKRVLLLAMSLMSVAPVVLGDVTGIQGNVRHGENTDRECSLRTARIVPDELNGQKAAKSSDDVQHGETAASANL